MVGFEGAHPAPKFKWYIADKTISDGAIIKNTKEEVEDEKINFISTLEYIGNPEDIGQMLKCEVIHKGYKQKELDALKNIAKAQLNLKFPPWFKPGVNNFELFAYLH